MGNWMLMLKRDNEIRIKLQYFAIIAYLQLCEKNPALVKYIFDLKVNYDLSITCKFGTFAETILMGKVLELNVEGLYIKEVKNVEEGLNYRYGTESKYGDANTMLLYNELNEMNEGKYYVVSNKEIVKGNYLYNVDNKNIFGMVGIFPIFGLRELVDYDFGIRLVLPGEIEDGFLKYKDKRLMIGDGKDIENWRSGNYLSDWGVTRFVNELSISELDLNV
jgi:hypothetical protein